MGLSGYNINPLMGGYDYASLMNNPYFQEALMSPNVNFRGQSQSQNAASAAAASAYTAGAGAGMQSVDGGIPVAAAPGEFEVGKSGLGTVTALGGLLALGGGAYYLFKKGKLGKAGDAVKSIFGGKTTEQAGNEAIKKLTATMNKHGEVRFMTGETVKFTDETAARAFADENCLRDVLKFLDNRSFNPKLHQVETFSCAASDGIYTIKPENGIITSVKKDEKEIINKLKKAQAGTADANNLEVFENILKELQKEKDIDLARFKGVSDIGFINTSGNDVLRMTMPHYNETPLFRDFTSLQRFDRTAKEVRRFIPSEAENALLNKELYESGKLVDGTSANFPYVLDESKGIVAHFEGKNIVKFEDAEGTYAAGSAGYREFEETYQKDINNLIRDVFERRKRKIPSGATIIPIS